ncbi:endolytic transglycosylase MltG [Candidatus Saccharibacteria bacterium]|nr:endolytic transglycosylase MltG [Candidatus Saccharibacteria bacterium]
MKMSKKDYAIKTSHRWRRIWLGLTITLAVCALVGGLTAQYMYKQNLKPLSASQKQVQVTIPVGTTVAEIAQTLEEKGVIRAGWAFQWYVRTNGLRDRLQAGTYSLRPNQSVQEVTDVLTNGKIETDLVTILPGQRLDQIRTSLITNAGFSEADVDAALKPSNYIDHPALVDKPVTASLEGYLYPESYQKTADTTPEEIITAALDQMQKHLTPEVRAAFTKQGLTVHEGVILASIVEQEVSKESDRPIVAQVFLTRRKVGMNLGSDVTAFYGAIQAGVEPSVLYDSPYNTRIHLGLPPGPISNVSESSLDAVAHPANTDYLYFVAGDDGNTYFSKTNEEHEALTEKYCKQLCSQ